MDKDSIFNIELPTLDWLMCNICQSRSKEKLAFPLESRRMDPSIGYKTIAGDMWNFKRIGEIPVSFKQLDFQNEDGLCILLEKHKAKWHKSCRDKYNNTNYDRVQKHTLTEDTNTTMTLTAIARISKRIKLTIALKKQFISGSSVTKLSN